MTPPRIEVWRGAAVTPHLPALATLRATVFRDWPYCYEADDPDYEARYLAAYARSPGSVFVLALDGERVVGASTGIPLTDDDAAFQAPFLARGIDPSEVFYFGESVLLPAYRGMGLGHAFFDAREAHARALGGFAWTAFCAVERAEDDPRKPEDYRPLHAFWQARGYTEQPEMRARLEWKEVGGASPVAHAMRFWLKPLTAA